MAVGDLVKLRGWLITVLVAARATKMTAPITEAMPKAMLAVCREREREGGERCYCVLW